MKNGNFSFLSDRPQVMGILNLTPDSFSDGGAFFQLDSAITRAFEIQEEGANLLDIGAESSRPGAFAISAEEEKKRLEPILQELKLQHYKTPISLDTTKSSIARWALENEYVDVINDISAFRDPSMIEVLRLFLCPVILMHMKGEPSHMQIQVQYENVVDEVLNFFKLKLDSANLEQEVMLDPGIGFGKNIEHSLALIKHTSRFRSLGHPVLIGASRKSFIGKILNEEVGERLHGSLSAAVMAANYGANWLRVHDVKPTIQALKMAEAISNV